jgi:hypothetical protein
MSAPPGSYYYDPVYGACEPCYSATSGVNECVYTATDPRDAGWLVDDEDVYPPDARGCGATEKYDLLMKRCRPLCPGEGSGGQEFVYADDNSSGSCMCPDATHFTFDPQSNTCVLKSVSARQLRGAGVPGDPFPPCDVASGMVEECYFPDANTCLTAFAQLPEEDGMVLQLLQLKQAQACPYQLCASGGGKKGKKDCVCVGAGLRQGGRGVCGCREGGKRVGIRPTSHTTIHEHNTAVVAFLGFSRLRLV